jgi:hypothetical protein
MPPQLEYLKKIQTPVIALPRQEAPAKDGASTLQIYFGRIREWIGRLFNMLGAPGAVGPTEIVDQLTNRHIRITVGSLFTKISVDGRDYFFNRMSGRYDGSGSGCGG